MYYTLNNYIFLSITCRTCRAEQKKKTRLSKTQATNEEDRFEEFSFNEKVTYASVNSTEIEKVEEKKKQSCES